MDEIAIPLGSEWLKLVEAASLVGVYPGTLYRWWRYGRLPQECCIKVGNTLYFERSTLEPLRTVREGNLR